MKIPLSCDSPQVVIGIDFGLRGALALVGLADDIALVQSTPLASRDYNLSAMFQILLGWSMSYWIARVVIERPEVRPRQWERRHTSAPSLIGMGRSLGVWEGLAAALHLPVQAISSHVWQRSILGGIRGPSSKEKALTMAQSLYPQLQLKPGEFGQADALLIATWGYHRVLGEITHEMN